MATILAFRGRTPSIHPTAFVAPTATVIGHVIIEEEASIWFGAVLRGDDPDHPIIVGARSSVQDNCVVHVSAQGPTVIGPEVTVGHGAVMESCNIGRGALIGMNAVLLQLSTVGEGSLIAAGAIVSAGAEIPPRHLAAGAPAQVKKELTGESLRWILTSSEHYVRLSREYLEEGVGVPTSVQSMESMERGTTEAEAP
jgi:carbonic anhydrase/acetyltransferase-like protein (isoleucine patch superfamily)